MFIIRRKQDGRWSVVRDSDQRSVLFTKDLGTSWAPAPWEAAPIICHLALSQAQPWPRPCALLVVVGCCGLLWVVVMIWRKWNQKSCWGLRVASCRATRRERDGGKERREGRGAVDA